MCSYCDQPINDYHEANLIWYEDKVKTKADYWKNFSIVHNTCKEAYHHQHSSDNTYLCALLLDYALQPDQFQTMSMVSENFVRFCEKLK